MPTIFIPTPMRRFSANQAKITLDGGPLNAVLNQLGEVCPGIGPQIFDESGSVKRYIGLFVNGRDVKKLDMSGVDVMAQDEVHIVPAMAGG